MTKKSPKPGALPERTRQERAGADAGASAGRKGPRKARTRSGDKRERILEAATKVFAANGFYATRVSEIAQAAGVADGTIYLYFENKDHVLISIFEDRIRKLIAFLRELIAEEAPAELRIRRVIEVQLGLLEERRDLAEVITVNLRQSSRLLKQYAAPLFNEYLEVLASVIADGQREGTLREEVNARAAARALWGALDATALTWALGPAEPAALKRAAAQVADLFLGGLRRPHPEAPPAGASRRGP
ncbi:MAG: TetR family transcriptional regulator [Myxococcales bacterium]|nr:TetR family transcriptional regulator [Myxococcales bacterium]